MAERVDFYGNDCFAGDFYYAGRRALASSAIALDDYGAGHNECALLDNARRNDRYALLDSGALHTLDARFESIARVGCAGSFCRYFGNDVSVYFPDAGNGAKYI